MFHELSVEASEPQEASQFFDIGRRGPRYDRLNFRWIRGDTLFTDNVPEIGYARLGKLALR